MFSLPFFPIYEWSMLFWHELRLNPLISLVYVNSVPSQRVFLEGNPYLLAVTMAVSVLHSFFDMLAFKNGMCHIYAMVVS